MITYSAICLPFFSGVSIIFHCLILQKQVLSLCQRHVPSDFTYYFDIMPIQCVFFVKDLGVFIDSALSLRNHISFVVGRSSKTLGMISRLTQNFRKPHCLLHLFKHLVRSRLEFASVIWNLNI